MFYLMTCEKQISYSPASPSVEGCRKKINVHRITSGLCPVTLQGTEDFTSTAMITLLAQINALPCAHCQVAGLDRQTQLAT
jgi:hypothetical protein